jgi:hypothetical protein
MDTDYVIHIATKHGRTWSYLKEENGWTQTAPTGIVRQLSGDQLLSHLLPPLAGDQPGLSVSAERKKRRPRSIDSSTDFADSRRSQKRRRKKSV